MNKKANIPITILVLGVLMLCGAVLLSFTFFDIKNDKSTSGTINAFNELNIAMEKYEMYKNFGFSSDKALDYTEQSLALDKIIIDRSVRPYKFVYKDDELIINYKISS